MTSGDLRVWTRRGAPIAAVWLTLVAMTGGCGPPAEEGPGHEAPADGGRASASDATDQASSSGDWIGDAAVGSRVDTEGAVPPEAHRGEFRPGETIYVSLEVGEAPPTASVHAVFLDAAGHKVAEDAKKVPARAGHLYFDSGDTADWAAGEGTITLSVDGSQVGEESFTLLEASPEGRARAQPPPG